MNEIVNIVPNVNIGYNIPNIKKVINTVAYVLGIENPVHVAPLLFKQFADKAYAVKQGCEFVLFIDKDILQKDELNNFIIRLIIHEMWHIWQMKEGYLSFSYDNTKAIYNGKEYTNLTPHKDRPFEKEAFKAENKYYSQVKALLNI